MMDWVIGGLILLAAALALRSILRDRKRGGCSGCAQAGHCPGSAARQTNGCGGISEHND